MMTAEKRGKTNASPKRKPKADLIVSRNPATGRVLGRVPSAGRQGIEEGIEKATQAFETWSRLSIKKRQAYLGRLADVVLSRKRSIAELIALEQGKTIGEALGAEVLATLGVLKDLSRNAHKTLRDRVAPHQLALLAHKRSRYRYVPYGVVAVISPWNFPFSIPLPQIAEAVVAGNTVLFKPAQSAVMVGQKIDELFKAAGFPEGVVNTVAVKGKDAEIIPRHPDIRKLVFTGSTPVGREIMAAAAEGVKPVLLELGGNDPAIVAADADIARAAKGIVWGAMFGAGQACAAVERAYVERPVADRFIAACVKEAAKLRVGDPLDDNTDVGPLSNSQQLRRVTAQVRDAVKRGAELLIGGNRWGDQGYFFEPTILSQVNHAMAVMTEETFGPVLPVMVVDSIDEAIQLANESVYGLSAYGWTRSRTVADRLMNEVEAGTVLINDSVCTWGEPNAPWGGMKSSGIGRMRSVFGLLEMVQLKYTSFDKGRGPGNAWWYPYSRETRRLFSNALDLLFTDKVPKKIIPMLALLRNRRFVRTAHWWSVLTNLHKLL